MNLVYLSTKEVSRRLNIDRTTLYRWRDKGKIKMETFDGQYYALETDILALEQERIKTGKVMKWRNYL